MGCDEMPSRGVAWVHGNDRYVCFGPAPSNIADHGVQDCVVPEITTTGVMKKGDLRLYLPHPFWHGFMRPVVALLRSVIQLQRGSEELPSDEAVAAML